MGICGIYQIQNIINQKRYIGSSVNVMKRTRTHRYYLNMGKSPNIHLQAAWLKYGKYNFTFSCVEKTEKENLIQKENFWIDKFCTRDRINGYNAMIAARNFPRRKNFHVSEETKKKQSIAMKKRVANGFSPMLGKHHSEETKRKLRIANKGHVSWVKGKHLTNDHKQKLRILHLGVPLSAIHKQKLRYAHLGKHHTKEHTEKIRQALKGRKRPPYSEEWKQNMSIARKGKPAWNKGKVGCFSQETREKMRLSHLGKNRGQSNPNSKINRIKRGIL